MNKLLEVKYGNMKIGNDTIIFNMTSATDCISAKLGLCQLCPVSSPNTPTTVERNESRVKSLKKCYAHKAEVQYPNVLPYRRRQAKQWAYNSVQSIANDLVKQIKAKRVKIKYFRFNESGDFRHYRDIVKLSAIADILWAECKVSTYGYTARKDLDFTGHSKHLTINGSGFMLNNEFKVVDKFSDKKDSLKCISDCSKCCLCKITLGKTIEVISH